MNADFILYGREGNKELSIRRKIDTFLNNASKEEMKMYYKIISSIAEYNRK